MYNIQVHVPYEKQQYIKKMNHYIYIYYIWIIYYSVPHSVHGVVLNIAMMLCYSRFCIHKFEDTQGIWIGSGMVRSLSVSQLITRVRAWSTHFVRHLNSHVYTNDSLTKCVTITCVHPWLTQNVCHRLSREYTPDILVKCVVDYYVCKPMTHSRSVSQAVTVTCAYPAMTRPLNVPLCVYTRDSLAKCVTGNYECTPITHLLCVTGSRVYTPMTH